MSFLLPRWRRNAFGLGSSAFARRYLRNHSYFLFLRVLRCFSSPGWLTFAVCVLRHGFPHSDIRGSRDICSSPQLFAACHVLLRLREPRHPPCALLYFLRSITCVICVWVIASLGFVFARLSFLSNMSMTSFVENNGFEPLTPCLQSRCSSQLS